MISLISENNYFYFFVIRIWKLLGYIDFPEIGKKQVLKTDVISLINETEIESSTDNNELIKENKVEFAFCL